MTHQFKKTIGTRAEVWHGNAKKTSGGLTKKHLMKNKSGRIVSRKKHFTAKKEMRLLKHGYGFKKGKFGYVKLSKNSKKMKGGKYALSPADVTSPLDLGGIKEQGIGVSADGISGAGVTNFGSDSNSVQFRAGMSGGMSRSRSRSRSSSRSRSRSRSSSRSMY